MTAAVLPLPTTRRTLGARRPVVRREDFTVLRGGAGGDRALHLIDLENLCGAGSTTVKSHLVHIYDKLGVRSRTSAVAAARKQGVL